MESSVAEGMARRLGSLAWHAAPAARRRSELRPLDDGLDLCGAEVRAHLRWGAVLHLEDLLLRRARFGMWDPARSADMLRKLRPIVRSELRWEWRRWQAEEERYLEALEAWTLSGVREAGGEEGLEVKG